MDAEQYVADDFQRQMRPPARCPHCSSLRRLWALGYYARNVSRLQTTMTMLILIRRFYCTACGKTVSLLPSFVQPYRLVQNATIESFFLGMLQSRDVRWWIELLRRYKKRFFAWIPEIDFVLGRTLPRSPPRTSIDEWRSVISAKYGNVEASTLHFVAAFQITLFGRYRCHRPSTPQTICQR